jgi:prepilin-type N-terminal cleavage/methylation domain-containing protein
MRRPAFTLVELMVSIALVLLLMLGVTRVFSTTQAVVSSNQAISNATRDARGTQAVLSRDFNSYAGDSPFVIIHNEARPAFRNLADLQGDPDGNPLTRDIDGDNQEGTSAGETTLPAEYNERNHRLDTLSFFARGQFKRQTGGSVVSQGSSPFLANMTTAEAWIWYGHERVANNFGTLTSAQDPGAGSFSLTSNGNNYFATDWILGRQATLMREASNGTLADNAGQSQIYIGGAGLLQPLAVNSPAIGAGTYLIQQSRYDLAATSISGFRQKLLAYLVTGSANAWQDQLFSGSTVASAVNPTRFAIDPKLLKPITPATLSQQAPIFLPGCSSFIVEYAGDYLAQELDPVSPQYGNVTGVYKPSTAATQPSTDGQIDFIPIRPPAGSPPNTPWSKRIRFYGLPRNAYGSVVGGQLTIPGYFAGQTAQGLTEVVPLRDVWRTLAVEAANTNGAPFERGVNNVSGGVQPKADYLSATGMPLGAEYSCAWGPNDPKPKLIRIIFTIDDPLGRTPTGQQFENVFEVP